MTEQEIISLGWIRDTTRSGYKYTHNNIYTLSNQSTTAIMGNKWIITGPTYDYPEAEQRKTLFEGIIDSNVLFFMLMLALEIDPHHPISNTYC